MWENTLCSITGVFGHFGLMDSTWRDKTWTLTASRMASLRSASFPLLWVSSHAVIVTDNPTVVGPLPWLQDPSVHLNESMWAVSQRNVGGKTSRTWQEAWLNAAAAACWAVSASSVRNNIQSSAAVTTDLFIFFNLNANTCLFLLPSFIFCRLQGAVTASLPSLKDLYICKEL